MIHNWDAAGERYHRRGPDLSAERIDPSAGGIAADMLTCGSVFFAMD